MKVTLQEQLINRLTANIQILPSNAKLPSERQLADKYEVSRNTVRAALMELEATGIVRRIHGKGTFVNRVNLNSDLGSSYKFGQQMILMGKNPTTRILGFEKKEANAYFADKLQLQVGELMFKIERLRLADNVPMMFERTFLPFKAFKMLSESMLEEQSMYDIFREYYY